jgi:Ca2+-binding EF-hand superfamily protein
MNRSALLLAGLLASPTALAQTAAAPPKDGARPRMHDFAGAKFTEADSNHDGNISQSEWQSARLREANEAFQRIDANRDGKLSRTEMEQARGQRREHGERFREQRERMRSLDTDGDQQLSRAEIGDQMPRLAANFDNLDSNRDGKLSRDEIRAGREANR